MKTCPYCGERYDDPANHEEQLVECPLCKTNFETGLPPKPGIPHEPVLCAVWMALLIVSLVCIALPFIWFDGDLRGGLWLLVLIGLAILSFLVKCFFEEKDLYECAKYNPEEYARRVTELRKKREAANDKRKEKLARLPACPICGSKEYVERISNTDRSVEVAVWGLGASSVGKQFECRKCRHAFNADSQTLAVDEDPVEELRRYKLLLDEGIITQDEFDEKKKQVLGL